MHYESFKSLTAGIQSITTSLALVGGGIWALWRFVLTREAMSKADVDLDLSFIHKQQGNWIVEGVALVKNQGTVRLDFKEFTYELRYLLSHDNFENPVDADTILDPSRLSSFRSLGKRPWFEDTGRYLEPAERSRHSFVASLPADTTIVLLSCVFADVRSAFEISKTYAVPETRLRQLIKDSPETARIRGRRHKPA